MTQSEKAAFIQGKLDELYPEVPIPLAHHDPFTLLVAVLLSAQCTDARVNTVTPALFRLAGTPEAMASLPEETIEAIIRPCGLSGSKSKALAKMSKQLIERHGGQVPGNFEDLEALAGVGHKTASVVMLQAFGVPAFPVDTHIHRLANRWGISNGSNVETTEKDLKAMFPEEAWAKLHLQMIYFGREICKARGHDAGKCEICKEMAKEFGK